LMRCIIENLHSVSNAFPNVFHFLGSSD